MTKMNTIWTKTSAFFMAVVILIGLFCLVPVASAKEEEKEKNYDNDINVDDDVELVQGTVGDPSDKYYNETKDWDQKGDYIGIRFSKDAWFVIVYGNEENPGFITMMSVQIRYLGGASIHHKSWDVTVPEVGIPVASVFFQSLAIMLEFDDTGFQKTNMFGEKSTDTTGAGNGLFDLETKAREDSDDIFDMDIKQAEPVYKAVSLQTDWEISDVKEIEKKGDFYIPANDREWAFTLTAEDLHYGDEDGNVWDKDFEHDGTNATELDKIAFTFHIGAEAKKIKIDNIPWYEIEVDGEGDNFTIEDSKEAKSKSFEGTAINGNFKYDHYIEGWDYSKKSDDTHLLMETVSAFGTFIPNIVNDWIDHHFIEDEIGQTETATYTTPMGDQELSVEQDLPEETTLVQKETITFKDNWRQVGNLTWVSNVTVDGKNKDIYAQIHAKQDFSNEVTDKKDGYFSGMVLISGYVYPAGDKIFHDPAYTSNALLINIPIILEFASAHIAPIAIGLGISFLALVVSIMIAVVRRVRKD